MVSGTRFLASSWSEWSEEIVCRARFRDLALAGLLSPRVAERCEVRVREALRFRTSPCLYHGDILGNWSNVLVDVHGRVCSLLDSLRGKVNAFVILHAAKAINRLFPQPDTPMLIGQERENRLRFARRARSLMEQLAFE